MKTKLLIFVLFILSLSTEGSEFKVGIASKVITPKLPIWLTGFASRTKPSNEVLHDLWAKALVIEENNGNRVIIVTTDLLGLSRQVSEAVADRIIKKYGIKRSQLLLNSSHTHSGPAIWPAMDLFFDLSQEDRQNIARYSSKLIDDMVEVIDSAFSSLTPMQVWSGHGSVGFAMNRREPTAKGIINGKDPNGPVDHDVPVLKVSAPDGQLKAVLFGYACHNTTLSNYQINGDYAGFAQIELQKMHPGATAMFLIGCAADQNPQPRGTVEIAMQHGKDLAMAVEKAISGNLKPVRPPIRTAYETVDLDFLPVDIESYKKDILGTDKYLYHRAELIMGAQNKGWDVSKFYYPLQAIRFNNNLTILGMSGEVVVDYSLKMKKEYADENLFMGGYCNEVMCYIPTKKILREGGYEPNSSMIYYGLPGPFAENVEDKITTTLHKLMKDVGARPSKKVK